MVASLKGHFNVLKEFLELSVDHYKEAVVGCITTLNLASCRGNLEGVKEILTAIAVHSEANTLIRLMVSRGSENKSVVAFEGNGSIFPASSSGFAVLKDQ